MKREMAFYNARIHKAVYPLLSLSNIPAVYKLVVLGPAETAHLRLPKLNLHFKKSSGYLHTHKKFEK